MDEDSRLEIEHFSFRHRDRLQLIVCRPIEQIGFRNAFSTRFGGVSPLPVSGLDLGNPRQDEREVIIENRRRFIDALEVSDWQLVTAKQVHSAEVRSILSQEDAHGQPATCDALTANIERVLLAVQTADCLPILIADGRNGACAAVHAGWRGTLASIVARTVEQMQMRYGSHPPDLVAALGPAIGPCCFEVGPEVVAQFRDRYDYLDDLISNGCDGGKAHLDLNRANIRQLADCGLKTENIFDLNLCTVCRNDLFFSYRAENGAQKPVGRLMGVIGKN